MSLFESLPYEMEDPVFALADSFRVDERQDKVNLGVGVYYNEEGNFCEMEAVSLAARDCKYKRRYQPIDGDGEFVELVQSLLLGENVYSKHSGSLYGAQTLGGTGALRSGANFLKEHLDAPVYIPDTTWGNHLKIFGATGANIIRYPYLKKDSREIEWEGMQTALLSAPKGSVVILHACCHNPSGVDLTTAMWDRMGDIVLERNLLPFFDIAYQGFAQDIESDTYSIRCFLDMGIEFLVAYSCSKNFGLYGERVGMLTAVIKDGDMKNRFKNNLKKIIRTTYSSPPRHGAHLVKTILASKDLRDIWQKELTLMRQRIVDMRYMLADLLENKGVLFKEIKCHNGFFSQLPLSSDAIDRLRHEDAIYMLDNGRINFAGLNLNNINCVAEALAKEWRI